MPLLQSLGLRPWACKMGGQRRLNRRVYFFYKGKKEKRTFQLVQPGAQLSITSVESIEFPCGENSTNLSHIITQETTTLGATFELSLTKEL